MAKDIPMRRAIPAVVGLLLLATSVFGQIQANYFGLDINNSTNWPNAASPALTPGIARLWDSSTRWDQLEPTSGSYTWTSLDLKLQLAQANGQKVIFTFGGVPQWANGNAANPSGVTCSEVTGGCVPPIDVNSDGSGTDAQWQGFLTAMMAHLQAAGEVINYYEPWNEPNCTNWWNAPAQQLVRLSYDAKTIIQGAYPNAIMLTPPMAGGCQNATFTKGTYTTSNSSDSMKYYLAATANTTGTPTGGAQANQIAFHDYPGSGNPPENIVTPITTMQSTLATAGYGSYPVLITEGGWGPNQNIIISGTPCNSSPPFSQACLDTQAGFLARMELLVLSHGIAQYDWYAWGNNNGGTLYDCCGTPTLDESGIAYNVVENLLIGATFTSACSASGTVYSCYMTRPGGLRTLAVWDTSQNCNSGCTTSTFSVPAGYVTVHDLAGDPPTAVSGGTIQIGLKPTFLTNESITITNPTPSETITSYAFNLTATVTGGTSAAYVIWTVDTENECMTRTPPYSCSWDPYNIGNGPHSVVATLYDSRNNVLATSSAVSFKIAGTIPEITTNNTYIPGWTISTSTPVTSNWTGTVTLSATLSGTYPTGQIYHVYVDGLSDSYSTTGAASASYALNTAKYPNGPHKVVYTYGSSSNNVWTTWENTVTFSNGATPMWLELSGRETWLCPTPSTGCPSSGSITATTVNTDMSTSSATISSCGTSSNPATATVALTSGACVETILRNGNASYIVTASNGLTREKWVFGYSMNINPCFGPDGRIHNGWVAGSNSCFFLNSMFFSTSDLTDADNTNPGVTKYLVPYQLAGWNVVEPGISTDGPGSFQTTSQSAFESAQSANISNWSAFAAAHNLYLHLDNDPWWRTFQFWATRGTQESYSPHGFTYLQTQWGRASNVIGEWIDEINSYGGSAPQQAASKMGSTISSVVASNGTCTVAHASMAAGLFSFENGYGPPTYEFIITGASSAGFNSAPGTYYTSSAQTDTTFTYPCASVSNGTYNASTDPNMLFEVGFDHGGGGLHGVYQANAALPNQPPPSASGLYGGTYTGGLTASGTGSCQLASFNGGGSGATATVVVTNGVVGPALTVTALGSGFSSAPTTATGSSQSATCSGTAAVSTSLTDYARWNQYQTAMADYFAATNPPLITWSNAAGTDAIAAQDWMYDPRMAQFAEMYNTAANSATYRPEALALGITSPLIGDHYRNLVGTTTEPFLMETQGIVTDYGMQGYTVPVASCSGNTITFGSPHGIYNILPWSTRVMVSSGACAGKYWVASAPTATTLTVWRNFGTTITVPSGTGRLTFSNGDTYTIATGYSISATSSATSISQSLGLVTNTGTAPYLGCERGTTFTFSGTGTALDGTTGYLPFNYPGTGNCSTWKQNGSWAGLWGAIPNLSGSGGTATINATNYFTFGLSASTPVTGPVYQYGGIAYCIVLGCAGQRAYLWGNGGTDPEGMTTASAQTGYYNTGAYNLNSVFGDPIAGDAPNQFGIMPGTGNPSVESAYWAMATGNYLAQRLAKYEFQPHVASPDYGPFIEAAAHSGTPGNMLILQNMAMNNRTVTVNLSSCDVPGQQKIRYLADYTGIAVSPLAIGVTSDTAVMTSGGTVAYLCPQNFAAELQQPTISARLADVANAARIVVRYAYFPYWVDNGTSVVDCGSGTCALPVDRQFGPIYYRLIYLDANSTILAVSDVQTL